MKKILFIIYSLYPGGVPSSLSCLYTYLKDKNCEVRVFPLTYEGPNVTSFRDITMRTPTLLTAYYRIKPPQEIIPLCIYVFVKTLKKICIYLRLDIREPLFAMARRRIMRTFDPSLVVAYQEGDNALFASMFEQKKKVAWIHFDYASFVLKERDESAIYSKIDNIVCVSKYTAGTFANRYPILKNKVKYIYNLFDEGRILKLSQEGINDDLFHTDVFTIISAGRISPEKGFSTIPAIAKVLKEQGCVFRWYIIGAEDKADELVKLKEEIEINGVSDSVTWLGGKNNPYPYFRSSDLYVSTSYTEACPMVFNEARILGLPIVSVNFGSSYEFIKEKVDGIIVTREAMPMVMVDLIKNKDNYQALKQGTNTFKIDEGAIHKQIDEVLSLD